MKIPDDFRPDFPLKKVSTFGIGGPAKFYVEVHEIAHLQEIMIHCKDRQLPFLILGKGSNSLFDDRGYNGLVIANKIDFLEKPFPSIWRAGAGYSFSLLGTQTAREGLSGLEFASGIPGSVGGAVFMNAGANGRETMDSLVSVDFVKPDGSLVSFKREELMFSYRHSSFHNMRGAIVAATFQLTLSEKARGDQIALIRYRQSTQPYGDKSIGCIFRNPPNGSAGALIEKCGLKGTREGEAEVSRMHANFLINAGEATSKDVLNLVKVIQEEVKTKEGIELECEMRYIPYAEDSD